MNKIERNRWVNTVVGEVLSAMVSDEVLRDALIFKGARVLNMHLGDDRQSLDVDSNFTAEFAEGHPDLDARRSWTEEHLGRAVRNNFENQNPVRFTLESMKVQRDPNSDPHPLGWDGLKASIRVTDEKNGGVRGLPAIEIDIASPELLGEGAVIPLSIDGHTMRGYTLQRIAGEKLRAFLTSLPAYRTKINSPVRAPRVKDLHDEARILRRLPIDDEAFWKKASEEFILACKSRYVDCSGLETFQESCNVTKEAYEMDATLAGIPFEEVEDALIKIVRLFEQFEVFPLRFTLPA
ncbi:MAG: nucleotidyl transferase AbiEii/AbiGii toxin family protein [Chthoniobacterales bacterium]|jgi:hypothetical protein|nr:nucleotidyl transferase AbiEii/AbiGii toxin family protein [Chthoniobacterales bacterium]